MSYLNSSLRISPSSLETSWWLAQAYINLEQWSLAERQLAALFHQQLPSQNLIHISYFRAHAWLGKAQEAEQQLLRLSPRTDTEMEALGVALCELNLLLGNIELAQNCLNRLAELDSSLDVVVQLRLMILASGWHEGGVQKRLEELRRSGSLSRQSWLLLIRTASRFRLWSYTESLLHEAVGIFGLSGRLADEFLLFLAAQSRYDQLHKALQPLPEGLSIEPALLRAQCLCNLDRFEEAKPLLEGLENLPAARRIQSNILEHLGEYEAALELKRAFVSDYPTDSNQFDLCLGLLALGHWQEAWPLYEMRFQIDGAHFVTPSGITARNSSISPHRRRVVVFGEQGVGDTIMMASMLPDLIAVAAHVTLFVQPRLVDLFQQSFPSLTVVSSIDAEEFASADACYGLGSLGRFFRPAPSSCPAKPYLVRASNVASPIVGQVKQLPPSPKIGICWRGGTGDANGRRRSIPLREWGPIFRACPDASWVSLQFRPDFDEIEQAKSRFGIDIHCFDEVAQDLSLTAAVLSQLDCVVTVQQSILHLSGALGVQAFVLLPSCPEWRYGLLGSTMPWYSTVRLYRQEEPSDWSVPLSRLNADLRHFSGRSPA